MKRRLLASVFVAAALTVTVSACGASIKAASATPRVAAPTVPHSTPKGAAAVVGPVHRVAVDGITVGYRQFGRGRPLLLITGRDATMSFWSYQLMDRLTQAGFRVTMFDNRGVGYTTDQPKRPLTIQLMATDTAALIGRLHLIRPTVVGWSMGGEIALDLAETDGARLGTVVTSGGDAGSRHYIRVTGAGQNVLSDPKTTPTQLLGYLFPSGQTAAVSAFVHSIELYPQEKLSTETVHRQTEASSAFAASPTVWDKLPGIANKVVVTNGSDDLLVAPENARLVAARIPHSVLRIFPGAGHAMMFQDPSAFVNLVKANAPS